ncbi:hypothetical protein LOAG_04584 [Loa loa]|uniref:C2 domain-containing protein n=1 Tax=Loa loa TaxID=7209 RepID=A0A1S0U1V1_LOALO|nr:hypothetical protein LOAG_04584 [Loa loa]EFO23905.1 hypothetical protein LOAG_04584 [Loa loa]
MRLSIALVLLIFCYALSEQFWIDIKVEGLEWSNNCNLYSTCIQPTLQLRLINIFNNETIIKTLNINFDKQQINEIHLISYWNEGIPDMIVSTITINGIDPDYDFSRLCDSTATIFPFQMAKNQTDGAKTLQWLLAVAIGCLITCFMLIHIFLTINRILKLRSRSNRQIKRRSVLKTSTSNGAILNVAENSCEYVRSRVFPISIESGNPDLTKSRTVSNFTPKHTFSANSSLCNSIE